MGEDRIRSSDLRHDVRNQSWDDGHVLDTRLADMLRKYGLPGTFYIAPRNVEKPASERLDARAIASLGRDFEIGGHTPSHIRLPHLSRQQARQEIEGGKWALRGHPRQASIPLLPGGEYLPEHVDLVSGTGFAIPRPVLHTEYSGPRQLSRWTQRWQCVS